MAQVRADDRAGGRPGGSEVSASFDAWYRQEHPRLVATLVLLTGDLALAADAVDEACARALERWDRVSAMTSPTGWTLQVARNACRRAFRRAALERRLLLRTPRPADVPPPAGELWGLVAQLPQRQREVAVLRYVADLREEEIAEVLDVTRSTVSTTLRAAHDRLARALRELPKEDDHA